MNPLRELLRAVRRVISLCIECDKYTFEIFVYVTLFFKGVWAFLPLISKTVELETKIMSLQGRAPFGGFCLFISVLGFHALLKNWLNLRKHMLFVAGLFHVAYMIFTLVIDPSSFIVPRYFIITIFCFIAVVDIKKEVQRNGECS